MGIQDLSAIRNVGIIAHIDAGKTTLTERFLYYSGKTHRLGDVDSGNTIMDYLDEERARGITIVSATASFQWTKEDRPYLVHLIDTPGHIDFTAEVERSLRVIDGAVVIFSGVEGVEAQSEKVWRQSDQYAAPKIAFINKLDRMGADFDRVRADIQTKFSTLRVAAFQIPVGVESEFRAVMDLITPRMISFGGDDGADVKISEIPDDQRERFDAARDETLSIIAELSGDIADLYLNEAEISDALLKREIRRLVLSNQLCPVFAGAARRDIGAQPVLDAIIDYLPSPEDRPDYTGFDPKTNEPIQINIHDDAFRGLVFKVIASGSGDLLYIRSYSGELKTDTMVYNPRTGEKQKMKRLLRLYSKNVEPVDHVGPGDIVGVVGLKNTTTGDTLCAVNAPVALRGVTFPEAVISVAVEPKSSKDKDKLANALELLCREDPTLRLEKHEGTGQFLLSGMGELHLEINCHRLRDEFHLEVRSGAPQVVYRETLKQAGVYAGVFSKAIGDKDLFAEVDIAFEPVPKLEQGLDVISEVKNNIPKPWVAAAVETTLGGLKTGGNWGYPLVYIRATIKDIRGVPDKTTEGAIAGATLEAVNAAIRAGTEMLEPVVQIEIMAPEEVIGEITGYLQARRAVIHGIDNLPDVKRLRCEVPLAEMFGFSKALPKLSGGRAGFCMEPCGYQVISQEELERVNARA